MPQQEYQPDSIDAWLSGDLSAEESAAMEAFFQCHPEAVVAERDAFAVSGLDPESLRGIPVDAVDAELSSLIARIQSGLPCETYAPGREGWREIVTPSDDPEILGTLGGYEISEVIANGSMGIVLKAYDPKLKRFMAIKALSPEAASNATARERFLREARAAAQLEHENILPVYEVCEAAIPWFAMRFVDGGSLQSRIEDTGPLDADGITGIGLQIARALAAAHEKGMIHRDIKPSNVLLEHDGHSLWVADFGIVRCVEDPSLTYPGAIAGTPRFMSPEQAAGHDLDERTDLFSFGLVFYFCATGENLLAGKTTAAVMAVLGSGKRFEELRKLKLLPGWQRRLISQLLEPDRAARPESAHLVAEAFAAESFQVPSSSDRRGWIAAAATAMIVAGFGWRMSVDQREVSTARPGSVLIEETGLRFEDLAEALESITGPSTLRLSGDLELSREVWVKFDVVIEGDPLSRPTVTVGFSEGHGIYFFRPFQVQGIRWVRTGDGLVLPILGSSANQGPCLVEDCAFILPFRSDKSEPGGRGLGFTGATDATVRRCHFESNEGTGLYLATPKKGESLTSVLVEDCLFTGSTAIEVFRWGDPGEIRLSMKNTVVIAEEFVLADRCDPLPGLSFDLVGNIIGARHNVILLRDIPVVGNESQIRWQGSGNVYGGGTHWLQSLPVQRPVTDFPETILIHRDEFARTFPGFSEEESAHRILPIWNPDKAPHHPLDLIQELRLSSDSPLRKSLEALDSNRASY